MKPKGSAKPGVAVIKNLQETHVSFVKFRVLH